MKEVRLTDLEVGKLYLYHRQWAYERGPMPEVNIVFLFMGMEPIKYDLAHLAHHVLNTLDGTLDWYHNSKLYALEEE
jgi:hypothetical protein